MSTLDAFLPPRAVKSRQDSGVFVMERCANPKCGKPLRISEPKYTLVVKGEKGVYCRECYLELVPKSKPQVEKVVKTEFEAEGEGWE